MELKGIRSDGYHRNYNGAAVTGVEKRAAKWLKELRNKVVRLDEKVFGVQQPALGPFQRRAPGDRRHCAAGLRSVR